jgi:hypothetical protein
VGQQSKIKMGGLRSDGGLIGYGGGLPVKKRLLKLEQSIL